MCIRISTGNPALWYRPVPVSTPLGDEGEEVVVVWVDGYAVIAVPSIGSRQKLVSPDAARYPEWRQCVVCLSQTDVVQHFEVDHAPRLAVVLGHDQHPRAKCLWSVGWHPFNHT